MDKTYEIGRGGGLMTFKVKDHSYDTVEFTIRKYLEDDKGKVLIDSGYTVFFSDKEFREFFGPIVNDLKVRIEHGTTSDSNELNMELQVTQTDEFKQQVRTLLHDSTKDLRIVFTKKDGTQREMLCTLAEQRIPVEKQPKTAESGSTTTGSALRVFDTEKQEWRSFRWDSVTKVSH